MRLLPRGRAFHAIIVALFAVPAVTGCTVFATYCDSDVDCAAAQVCGAERTCVSGERDDDAGAPEPDAGPDAGVDVDGGRPDAGIDLDGGLVLTITSVEGLGSVTPISVQPVDGGVLSPKRLADRLLVTGTGFDAVSEVELAGEGTDAIVLTIAVGRSDGEIELIIPTQVSTGLMTLTLLSTSLATAASAQVFVVQGEAAPPIVSVTVAADGAQCANGGTVLTVGPDTDNDGTPNSGAPVIVCNGAPGDVGALSCVGSDCTVAANLNVTGTLAVDGSAAVNGGLTVQGDDVLRVISVSETRNAANFDEIQSQLADLRNYRIVAPAVVTISLTAAAYTVTAPIEFLHADADRIEIIGNTADPFSVALTCTDACFRAGLGAVPGFVNGVQLTAASTGVGIGVDAVNGGSWRIGRNVDFFEFFIGIRAERGGSVFVDSIVGFGISIRDCTTGILVNGASTVEARNVVGTGLLSGVVARQGHVDASFSGFAGRTALGTGLSAESGGTIFAQAVDVNSFEVGLSARNNGMLLAVNSSSDQNSTGALSSLGGTVSIPGAAITNNTTGVLAQSQSIMQVEGVTFNLNGNDFDVEADSLLIQ